MTLVGAYLEELDTSVDLDKVLLEAVDWLHKHPMAMIINIHIQEDAYTSEWTCWINYMEDFDE